MQLKRSEQQKQKKKMEIAVDNKKCNIPAMTVSQMRGLDKTKSFVSFLFTFFHLLFLPSLLNLVTYLPQFLQVSHKVVFVTFSLKTRLEAADDCLRSSLTSAIMTSFCLMFDAQHAPHCLRGTKRKINRRAGENNGIDERIELIENNMIGRKGKRSKMINTTKQFNITSNESLGKIVQNII